MNIFTEFFSRFMLIILELKFELRFLTGGTIYLEKHFLFILIEREIVKHNNCIITIDSKSLTRYRL